MRYPYHLACLAILLGSGCTSLWSDGSDGRDLTSVEGAEYVIEYEGFVYVPVGADDDQARWQIQRQIKSSLGALRERKIGVRDRDARSNLDATTWTRTTLEVVDDDGQVVDTVDRVTYHYRDVAVVDRDEAPTGPLALPLLFGDYAARYDVLVPACTDDSSPYADSLWYHYHPGRWACRNMIADERYAIADATASLDDANSQIAIEDRDRVFLETRATLTPVTEPAAAYPEYDQLWGFAGNTSRTHVVAYAFFGVDSNLDDPGDYGLREYLRFQRTLRQAFGDLRVTHTAPFAMLLDFWIDGRRIAEVSFDDVERWILDDTGYPPEVGNDAAKRAELERQVIERFSRRWIYWELPVRVSRGGETRDMIVQVRSYYGPEDGNDDIRTRARWRYLEAFWHGDIFAYTGHSHFGHGPLAPFYYSGDNFPDRYQVMLVNSCLSFNYYDQDFIDMHPGGSAKLDVVSNGLAAYWQGMGEATAHYLLALVDGQNKSWSQLLTDMRVNLPWHSGYDPMRVVNGDHDNVFTPEQAPLSLSLPQ